MGASAILIDGDLGGAGGQVLRTALALSAITGKPFTIQGLRERRLKPGLRPHHREVVLAVAKLCEAEVAGDELGSTRLELRPRSRVASGDQVFDAGEGGSATLLFQTVCWPIALAGAVSQVTVRGATHQEHGPTFHDLALVWAPSVARLGFRCELALQTAAFGDEPGGELTARIEPAHAMPPLDLRHRGTLAQVQAVASVGGLSSAVAERLAERASRRLRAIGVAAEVARLPLPTRGSAGCHLLLVASFERSRAGFGVLGGRGQAPERCADVAVEACERFLCGGAAVDAFQADQLLLPAALVAARLIPPPAGVTPSVRYSVPIVTQHLLATAEVVRRFLDVDLSVVGREGQEGEVRVQPHGAGVEVAPLPGRTAPDTR